MSAKEMFEKIGYKLLIDDKDIIIYRFNFALGGYKDLIFHKHGEGMIIDYDINDSVPTILTFNEIKAINKQIEELEV